MNRFALKALIAGLVTLACAGADAQTNYYFAPKTSLYVYQERDIFGSPLDRTLGVQDLTMAAYNNDFYFPFSAVVFARLWSEFGRDASQSDALRKQGRVWAQLLTAYIEGGRIFKSFDLKLGRFLQFDQCGATLIDGGAVTFSRNFYLGAQFVAGSKVLNADNRILTDGTRPTPDFNPFSLEAAAAEKNASRGALLGASVFLDNVNGSSLQFSWRRAYSGNDVEEERVALGGRQELLWNRFVIEAEGEFNLVSKELQTLSFGGELTLWRMSAGAQYQYFLPLFPAWSIFTVFPYVAQRAIIAQISAGLPFDILVNAQYARRVYGDGALFLSNYSPEGQFADEFTFTAKWKTPYEPLTVSLYGLGGYGWGGNYSAYTAEVSLLSENGRWAGKLSGTAQIYGDITWYDQLVGAQVSGVGYSVYAYGRVFIVDNVFAEGSLEYIGNAVLKRDLRGLISLTVEAVP